MVEGRASGAAMKEFAPWEARKGSWARVDTERWLAQAHRQALCRVPKGENALPRDSVGAPWYLCT